MSQMASGTLKTMLPKPKGDAWQLLEKSVGGAGDVLHARNRAGQETDKRNAQLANGAKVGVGVDERKSDPAQVIYADSANKLNMPWDASPPDARRGRTYSYPLRDFPLHRLRRGRDEESGEITITGQFTVDGDAVSDDLLLNMTSLYSANGILDSGQAWRTSISFVRAEAGVAGDISMNWMSEDFFSSHPDLDRVSTGAYMGHGTRSMWLNRTLFDRSLLAQSGLVESRRIDEFNDYLRQYTPGHELFHGFGFGHAINSTRSISSYARNPRMTNSDFSDLWNLLKENNR